MKHGAVMRGSRGATGDVMPRRISKLSHALLLAVLFAAISGPTDAFGLSVPLSLTANRGRCGPFSVSPFYSKPFRIAGCPQGAPGTSDRGLNKLVCALDGPDSAVAAATMKWVSSCAVGFSTIKEGTADAISRCKEQLGEGGSKCDLALVFVSARYSESRGGAKPASPADLDEAMEMLKRELGVKHVIGCLGAGVIGSGDDGSPEEFENFKAISVMAASLPGVTIKPWKVGGVGGAELPVGTEGGQRAWRELVGGTSEEEAPVVLLLGDPRCASSGMLKSLTDGLDFGLPGCTKIGGLAAPSRAATQKLPAVFGSLAAAAGGPQIAMPSLLGLGDMMADMRSGGDATKDGGGIVGVTLSGNIAVETMVAQGCRAIGAEYEISKVTGNMVNEVVDVSAGGEGLKPLEALKETVQELTPNDRQLAQSSLLLGIAADSLQIAEPPQKDSEDSSTGTGSEPGRFVVRQVLGASVADGGILVGEVLRVGQRMRFHLRDAEVAASNVDALMSGYKRQRLGEMMSGGGRPPAAGVLLFACVGRGRQLFNQANFDSRSAYLSTGVSVAGVFCDGEIGPLSAEGGATYLHSFSSVYAIIRPKTTAPVAE